MEENEYEGSDETAAEDNVQDNEDSRLSDQVIFHYYQIEILTEG